MNNLVVGVLFVISIVGFRNANPVNIPDSQLDKAVVFTSPVDNFIDVSIKSDYLPATLKNNAKFFVRILNLQGIAVYSGTKTDYKFEIFTGGLRNGDYKLSVKCSDTEILKEFKVEHKNN